MATKTRVGFYWKLKDKTLPWADRVKLARYVWKDEHINLPNKEQVVLDWLCMVLSGKIRVPEEEAIPVWRCLTDVLQTRKCLSPQSGHSLVLKSSLIKVLLEKLQNVKDKRTPLDDMLLGCMLSILESPMLNHVVVSKYEFMLQLTSSAVRILHSSNDSLEVTSVTGQLVMLSLKHLQTTQRQRANPQQVIQQSSGRLLLPVCQLMYQLQENENSSQLQAMITQLNSVIFPALLSKDLLSYYELYLKLKTEAVSSESSPPRFIEAIFTQLQTGYKDASSSTAVEKFISIYLAEFVKAYKQPGTAIGFLLFIHLNDLLGLKWDKTNESVTHSGGEAGVSFVGLASMLKVVSDHQVYDMAEDTYNDHKNLVYLKALGQWLLQSTQRPPAWFETGKLLMSLNYHVFETSLIRLLKCAWTEHEFSIETSDSQSSLLCELVRVYTKLRQVPKFFSRLLEAVNTSNVTHQGAALSVRFRHALEESIGTVPQQTAIGLWRSLVEALNRQKVPLLDNNDDPVAAARFILICDLTVAFLWSVRLADYSITATTTTVVQELMSCMAKDILEPLLTQMSKVQPGEMPVHALPTLQLLSSWGELHILLKEYAVHYSLEGAPHVMDTASNYSDLSFTFPMLHGTLWGKLVKKIESSESSPLRFILHTLMVQDMKSLVLFSNTDQGRTSVSNRVLHLCDGLDQPNQPVSNTWDGQVLTVTSSNLGVAEWSLMVGCLPLVLEHCSQDQLEAISTRLVSSVSQEPSPAIQSSHHTVRSISLQFVSTTIFQEMALLHAPLCKAVWKSIGNCLFKSTKSPKKMKSSNSSIRDLLTEVTSSGSDSQQEMSAAFNNLLGNLPEGQKNLSVPTAAKVQQIKQLLSILETLPLESCSISVQAAAVSGCVALLTLLPLTTQPLPCHLEMVTASSVLLRRVLSESRLSTILPGIHFGKFVEWMVKLSQSITSVHATCYALTLDLTQIVLRHATKGVDSFESLEDFMTSCVGDLKDCSTDNSADHTQLNITLYALRLFAENINKLYLPENLRDVSGRYHALLFSPFLKLLKTVKSDKSLEDSVNNLLLRSLLLSAYSREIGLACNGGRKKTVDKLAKCMDNMCTECTQLLQVTKDQSVITSSLDFINTLCKHKADLEEKIPKSFLNNCWPTLLRTLGECTKHAKETDIVDKLSVSAGEVQPMEVEETVVEDTVETTANKQLFGLHKKDLSTVVRTTLTNLLILEDVSQFQQSLKDLLEGITFERAQLEPDRVVLILTLWKQLLDAEYNENTYRMLVYFSQMVLAKIQEMVLLMSTASLSNVDIITAVLGLQVSMLSLGPEFLSPQSVPVCFYACLHAPLDQLSVNEFVRVYEGMYYTLNAMLVYHPEVTVKVIPSFLTVINLCLFEKVIFEGRQRAPPLTDKEEGQVVHCAQLIDRLCSLLVQHKVEFSKVAVYLLADYTNYVQKVTLLPKVKNTLMPGIYKLLDLCDKHAVAQLHTVLPSGVKEIFKTVFEQYHRYHKYTGRV